MIDKQRVLDGLRTVVDSINDGKLILEGVRQEDGVEVWDVKHAPDGANPITEMMMGGFRRGAVKVFEDESGPVYQIAIYGGEDAITEMDGKWREAPVRCEQVGFGSRTASAVVERLKQENPNLLIVGMSALFDRSLLVEAVDSATREEKRVIVALTPDGSAIDSVKFVDDPDGLGL